MNRRHKPRRTWKRVNFKENYEDYQCLVLALMGFSTYFIETETGLSPGQISYRLYAAARVLRRDYRDGNGLFAKMTLNSALGEADKLMKSRLNIRNSPLQ